MTAPVFLFTPDTLAPASTSETAQAGDVVVLFGPEARHAVMVRRLRVGERVDLVDGRGVRLVGEVVGAEGKDRLLVRVRARVVEDAPRVELALVQALAKGGRDEQAVETATEVGVEVVLPWQAGRSVAVWKGPKVVKGRERWQATATEAAKQSRRARVPQVEEPVSTAGLVAWVRQRCAEGGVVLVLHEEATASIGGVNLPKEGTVGVIVGPEGGISAEETTALEEAGAVTVRLGPHVMRTASAGPVALAVLAQKTGLWE